MKKLNYEAKFTILMIVAIGGGGAIYVWGSPTLVAILAIIIIIFALVHKPL